MLTKPGILSSEDIIINDIPLNTISENDSVAWIVTDLEGWWGLPDIEVPDDPRPYSQDGSYYTTGRFTARNINLKGYILPIGNPSTPVYDSSLDPEDPNYFPMARTVSTANNRSVASRNAFNRALILVRKRARLQVREDIGLESVWKTAEVQISSRPLLRISKSTGLLEFDISLRATDPVKYSAQNIGYEVGLLEESPGRSYSRTFEFAYGGLGTSNTVIVPNKGSYASKPIFTVIGPVENPMIEHIESGKFLKINGMVETGAPLSIDVSTRQILAIGENRRNKLVPTSRWFNIDPGINTIRFTGIGSTETHDHFSAQYNTTVNPVPLEPGTEAMKVESNVVNLFPNPHPMSFTGIGWGAAPDADTDFKWIEDEPGPNQLLRFPRAIVNSPGTEPTYLQGWTGSFPYVGTTGQQWGAYIYYRTSHDLPIRMTISFWSAGVLVGGATANFTGVANTWDRIWAIGTSTGNFDEVSWRIAVNNNEVLPAGGTFDIANIMVLNTGTVVKTYFDPRPSAITDSAVPRSIEPYFMGELNNSASSFRKVARGWDTSTEVDNDFQIFENSVVVRRPGTKSIEVRKDWSVSNFNNKRRLAFVTNIGAAASAVLEQPRIYPDERNYASVYIKCDVPDLYFSSQMRYVDIAGNTLVTKTSPAVDLESGKWRRIIMWDLEGGQAPVNASKVVFTVEVWTRDYSYEKKTSSVFFQDAKIGHVTFKDEGYFDGDFEFAEWEGLPHNSESRIPQDVPASQKPTLIIDVRDAWIE